MNNDKYTDPNKDNFRTNSHAPKMKRKTKYTCSFKIPHLNIRSLIEHIDQFRYFLKERQFDIICLNETILDETINDHEVSIQGYDIVRKDSNHNNGKVATVFMFEAQSVT